MTTQEIFKRLRIGLSLVVGFATGKLLAAAAGPHASEIFIGGFGLGVMATHGVYWLVDSFFNRNRPG